MLDAPMTGTLNNQKKRSFAVQSLIMSKNASLKYCFQVVYGSDHTIFLTAIFAVNVSVERYGTIIRYRSIEDKTLLHFRMRN